MSFVSFLATILVSCQSLAGELMKLQLSYLGETGYRSEYVCRGQRVARDQSGPEVPVVLAIQFVQPYLERGDFEDHRVRTVRFHAQLTEVLGNQKPIPRKIKARITYTSTTDYSAQVSLQMAATNGTLRPFDSQILDAGDAAMSFRIHATTGQAHPEPVALTSPTSRYQATLSCR